MFLGIGHNLGRGGIGFVKPQSSGVEPAINALLAQAILHIDPSIFPVDAQSTDGQLADLSPAKAHITDTNRPLTTINGKRYFVMFNSFIRTDVDIDADTRPKCTIFTVHIPAKDNALGLWGIDNGGWDRLAADGIYGKSFVADKKRALNIPHIFTPNAVNVLGVAFGNPDASQFYASEKQLHPIATYTFPDQSSNNAGRLTIGCIGPKLDWRYSGHIGEMIVLPFQVSEEQAAIIGQYLVDKWVN